jgi:hypothetical protein
MTPFEYVIDLDCGDARREKCRIVLRRQTPQEKLDNAPPLPKVGWPATFLCLRHMQLSARTPASTRRAGPQGQEGPCLLWRVQYECGHENCGRQETIYVPLQPDAETVRRILLTSKPAITCYEHLVHWRDNLLIVEPVEN